MKNKIMILFLFSLLVPAHFSFAYIPLPSSTDIGGSANPINIQIQPNSNEQWRQKNLLRESQLKIQYGYSIYSSCKSSVCGMYYNAIDPFTVSSCLSKLEATLGLGRCQAQKDEKVRNLQCDTGYVKLNGECVSFNESCNLQYPNTFFLNYNESGKRICDCKTGYQWNEQKTSCIIDYNLICKNKFGQSHTWNGNINENGGPDCVETKSNDQVCQDSYGVNSNWNGKLNDEDRLVCDCKMGYQWNQEQTQCIIIPKIETKIITPTIVKVPEVKTEQNEIKEEITNITKTEPINLNQEVTAITTEEVKPKSFWIKIKSWFGF